MCTNYLTTYAGFFTAVFLADTAPSSGRILERGDAGSLTPIFQLTNLVYRPYPQSGGAMAYSYRQLWGVTPPQVDSLLAGRWWAEIAFPNQTYLGQFVQVPEPSALSCGVLGGFLLLVVCRVGVSETR